MKILFDFRCGLCCFSSGVSGQTTLTMQRDSLHAGAGGAGVDQESPAQVCSPRGLQGGDTRPPGPLRPLSARLPSLLHFRTLFEFVPFRRRGPHASGSWQRRLQASAELAVDHIRLRSGPWAGSLLESKGRRHLSSEPKELGFFGLKRTAEEQASTGIPEPHPPHAGLVESGGRRRSPYCLRMWTQRP